MPELSLLTVHAHPDDESSKGAGTVARYHAEGVRTTLVVCTGGEEGDILNPAVDPSVRDRLPELRRAELTAAAELIGYDVVEWLGYRDSGMPGTPANQDPRSFACAPLDEAVGRLVAVLRRERPQVVVTYPKDQAGYLHPDHLRVNEISELAFDAAADAGAFPDAGPAWRASKLYYVEWSSQRMRATHEKFLELGMPSPFDDQRLARLAASTGRTDPTGHAVVDIRGYVAVAREALRAHTTQVDPTSPMWFGLPQEVADEVWPYDEYLLARNLTDADPTAPDLFAGVRSVAELRSRA